MLGSSKRREEYKQQHLPTTAPDRFVSNDGSGPTCRILPLREIPHSLRVVALEPRKERPNKGNDRGCPDQCPEEHPRFLLGSANDSK